MTDLSPELKELVLVANAATAPSEADSTRIFVALRVRLGDSTMFAESVHSPAATSATGIALGKLAAASVAGLALLGGFWFVAARNPRVTETSSSTPASTSVTAATESTLPAVAATPAQPQLAAIPSTRTVASVEARPVSSHHPHDNLSEEVSIMSRAETALHSGKPEVALRLLNEHERRFGNGLMREERIAARVQALCALGRVSEADSQMARLSPKSLHGKRDACGSR